jgi:hypothetical protein
LKLSEAYESDNRDKPLSFHWKALNQAWLERLDLPPAPSENYALVRASILLEAHLVGRAEPDTWVSYSRRKEFYANGKRYRGVPYTFNNVIGSIDEGDRLGLLENVKVSPGQRGRQSTFRATGKLLETINQPLPIIFDPCETVRLRDADKNLVDYRDTVRTDRMRKRLAEINKAIAAIEIDLSTGDHKEYTIQCGEHVLYPAMQNLYRVFNRETFSCGGRLYGGWWQQARKADRKFLTIDGQDTVEIDYPSLHPSMLYAMVGEALSGDPYDINGWDRKLVKVAFNVLVNARTDLGAERAIAQRIGGKGSFETARNLIEAIKIKHIPIADAFGSDAGSRLMRTDSDMAEHVLLSLIKKGIVGLPIHDSYITQVRSKGALLEAMAEALERFVLVGDSVPTSTGYADSVPHMERRPSSPFPLPFLVLPPGVPSQLELFGRSVVSVPFRDIRDWTDGIAPSGMRKAVRHELKRRNLQPKLLAKKIGISRPQLVNILQGRFGAGPHAAKALREFVLEGAETVGLVSA